MSLDSMQAACNHTPMGHLFYHVLCPTQSLTKRATIVAFGCLLLVGGLFAAYSAISKYLSTPPSPKKPSNPEIDEQATLDNSKNESVSQPEIVDNLKPMEFVGKLMNSKHYNTFQPVNCEIATLATSYFDHIATFKTALKAHQINPWDQEDVLQAADALIKIAYKISCLTLEDLKPFTETLIKYGHNERTYAQALTQQDSYQIHTSYYCTNVYHWIRAGILWDGNEVRYPTVSEAYAHRFYKKETRENSWNAMYNDYCDRLRSYVNEEDLKKADERLANWTVKDTESKTFKGVPDKQPGHQYAFLDGIL